MVISELFQLKRLMSNQWLSAPDLDELQNRKLRAVVKYAYENVSYYRSLFSSIGLSPEDIRTVEDLKHIPITTKDDLRTAGEERIIARDVNLSSCITRNTSGSTGKSFTVYLTRGEAKTRRLVEFRALLSMGFRPQDRLTILGPEQPHRTRLHQRLGLYRSENISPLLSIKDQIRRLQRMRPTVLWAYPTVLRALLQKVDYRLSKLARPRTLITSAEVFDEVMRERIRADLNPEMFNFYGAIEVGRIAAECPAHEGLHVNADHLILECLDGHRLAERRTLGVAVLTTLNNFAMPFIRYRLGDICTLIEKKCFCGSSFPLIEPPLGRKSDMIRLPSGKLMSPNGLYFILNSLDRVDQFRFIQESYEHLVLQIVFFGNPQDEMMFGIRSRIMEYLGEPVRLDIQIVDFIQEEKLKFRAFILKLRQSDL